MIREPADHDKGETMTEATRQRIAAMCARAIDTKGAAYCRARIDILTENIYRRLPSGDYGRGDVRRIVLAILTDATLRAPALPAQHEKRHETTMTRDSNGNTLRADVRKEGSLWGRNVWFGGLNGLGTNVRRYYYSTRDAARGGCIADETGKRGRVA